MEGVAFFFCIAVLTHTAYTVPPVPTSECRTLMDLVLVVDGSDSITMVDYVKQRIAISSLMKELHLGPRQTRVGIVVYSSTIAQVINITFNLKDLVDGARGLVHPRDGTMTSLGIARAKQLFTEQGRPDVPWVCIVITDGLSKNPALTAKEAAGARQMGVNMFAVGISHFIEKSELEAIASDPTQVLMLKTFDQLSMSLSSLMKVVCPCPPPPILIHSMLHDGPRSIGSTRKYICDAGYQPMGVDTIECSTDSKWSPLHFSCHACPPPPIEFGHGIVSAGPNTLDTSREYICSAGYTSPERLFTTCLAGPLGPIWTAPNITCRGCPPIPAMQNGYLETQLADALIGSSIVYHCSPGFIPTGPIESTCVDKHGIPGWIKPMHSCIACGPPPKRLYADIDQSGLTLVNTVRVYSCLHGYHPTGPMEALCMGEKGVTYWHHTEHTCRACDHPPVVPHTILHDGDTLVGTVRTYVCLPGFQATGPIEVICMANQGLTFWDDAINRCLACEAPTILPNAILDPVGETLVGSIRRYSCMDGFVPSGPIEIGCITGKGSPLWTSPEFHCVICGQPPHLPHAILDQTGDNLVGHRRTYRCMKGFVPTELGPIVIECVGEYLNDRGRAFWSLPSHECTACPPPLPMDFADLAPGETMVGSTRRYKCHNGYYATGPMVIECLRNATWSTSNNNCTACGQVPMVPNADALPGPHILGTVRPYSCHRGFVPDSPPEIVCLIGAKWSNVTFTCIACKGPYTMQNAVLEPGDNLVGAIRRYTCLPGYLGTGPITSTCAVPPKTNIPDWSTPVHFCKDCGEPYPVKKAKFVKSPRTIGSVQIYKCKAGFVPSGPPNSHCMQNAEWTPPEFKCITCGDPPMVEYAHVDKVGTNLVHTVRAYTCIKGFIATGPIDYKCYWTKTDAYSVPYWKIVVDNRCKDCGVPPAYANAYSGISPTTIGSVNTYSCSEGYEMYGANKVTCLRTGEWSRADFMCNVRTTTTTTTPVPVREEPSVCDGCRMMNGVGYMNHPFDCTKYVQCFYSTKGIEAVYMPCPFGQYWDQEDLTCKPADDVDCQSERCLDPGLQSYKDSDSTKCCAYWVCVNGKSVAKCCGDGFRYVSNKGCEPDPSCEAECPWEDMFPDCDKKPLLDKTVYEQHIGNGYWVKMPCAPGTAFEILDCECSLRTKVIPGYVCRPELQMNFDDGYIKDVSGKNVYIINERVQLYEGAAYFDGNARIIVNRFSNTAFHGDLVIKLRYNEQLGGPTSSALQALLTNGDCGDDPSIIIAKLPGYVLCGAKTSTPKSFALPTVDKEWKEVIYIHNEKRLEGKVCGAAYNKWSQGPIHATHCGIQIGYGTKMFNFVGLMDDIALYQCRPSDDILSVYGGRSFPPQPLIPKPNIPSPNIPSPKVH